MSKVKMILRPKSIALGSLLICFVSAATGSVPADSVSESEMRIVVSDTLPTSGTLPASGQIYRFANNKEYIYEKPKLFQFLFHAPKDFYINFSETFRKNKLWKLGAIAAATTILVAYDQPMLDKAKDMGRRLNLSSKEGLTSYFDFAGMSMRGPTDLGSAIFFIGDGWTHSFIAASFLGYGLTAKNNRALQTASQLVEGFLTTGLTVQFLKHISGRETPNRASAPGGTWKLFPHPSQYSKNQPKYGAYPSGHMATSMMTVTVIAGNYPDQKYIRPLGYTLMTLLAFQMMNNGVHWASDYPLGIALGYTFGKIAVRRGRTEAKSNHSMRQGDPPTSLTLTPLFFGQSSIGARLQYSF
jgi:hypothetical protein